MNKERYIINEIATNNDMVDFFVSYNHMDEQHAQWISWILEEAGRGVDYKPLVNVQVVF
ncbi:hypothetical protein AAFX88_004235 [Bacillus cereus]